LRIRSLKSDLFACRGYQARQAFQVFKAIQENKDHPGPKVQRAPWAHQALPEILGLLVLEVLQDLQDQQAILAQEALPVFLVPLENREILEQLGLRVLLDLMDLKEVRARKDQEAPLEQRVHRVLRVQLDSKAILA
jgi:hypothetical protein